MESSQEERSAGGGGGYERAIRAAVARLAFPAMFAGTMSGAAVTLFGLRPAGSSASLAAAAFLCVAVAAACTWWIARRVAGDLGLPANSLLEDALRSGETALGLGITPATVRRMSTLKSEFSILSKSLVARGETAGQTIAELVRIKEHAQTTNHAKSQFLANMSHDLRTPLNAIVGYATLLQEDAVAEGREDQNADLTRILEASRRLIELISDVLDLSNIETGKLVFQPGIMNVKTLIENATAHLDTRANGNSFSMEIDPAIGIMVGDEAKTKRCLGNLLSNAFKFTKEGKVALRVTSLSHAGVEQIRFEVSDTGAGMVAKQIEGIFDPLDEADPTRAAQFGGSGLGLAVTRRLARLMSGEVTVESTRGQGSTFALVLPRELGRSPQAAGFQAEVAALDNSSFTKTALVIDDDHTAVALMRRRLAQHGYGVIAASDGDTGLALARSEQPDLIVLDIFMPGKNGYDVLELIRADAALRGTPVIVATIDDDRVRGLQLGASEFLTKPVGSDQLVEVLNLYRTQIEGEVLIVDDDPDAGDIIARTVAQVGLRSRRAFHAVEALAMLRDQLPSAIVLDLTMPGMSGLTLLEALRGNVGFRDIPVVIVSGRVLTLQEHEAVRSSGCTYYTKGDCSPRQIAQTLKLALAA